MFRTSIRVGLLIWLCFAVITLSGFCLSKMRFVSDSDLVAHVILRTSSWRTDFPEPITDLAAAKAYFERHPECCVVGRWSGEFHPGGLMNLIPNAIFGRRFFEVQLVYPRKLANHEGKHDKYYWHWVALNCCGERIVDPTGITSNRPPHD